jgi:hypothetical protein
VVGHHRLPVPDQLSQFADLQGGNNTRLQPPVP